MSFIATKEVSDTAHGRVTPPSAHRHETVQEGTPAHLEPAGRDGSLTAAQVSPRPERVYSRFDLTVRGDLD
jgi:hypothetical protein